MNVLSVSEVLDRALDVLEGLISIYDGVIDGYKRLHTSTILSRYDIIRSAKVSAGKRDTYNSLPRKCAYVRL